MAKPCAIERLNEVNNAELVIFLQTQIMEVIDSNGTMTLPELREHFSHIERLSDIDPERLPYLVEIELYQLMMIGTVRELGDTGVYELRA